jgi:hypothetical protein
LLSFGQEGFKEKKLFLLMCPFRHIKAKVKEKGRRKGIWID